MATQLGINIHFDAPDVGHRHQPGWRHGTLDIGKAEVHVYFDNPEQIHAVIAHLVALENEMTADEAWRLTPKGVEVADDSRCECGHPQDLHDEKSARNRCLTPDCGCTIFRLAAPVITDSERTDGPGGVMVGPFGADVAAGL